MKVIKSVNLHSEYVPRCFFLKKVEHKLTSKKITDIPADTLEMKKWENGSLIITNRLSRRRKIMVHTLF